jgi:hypothetical protein
LITYNRIFKREGTFFLRWLISFSFFFPPQSPWYDWLTYLCGLHFIPKLLRKKIRANKIEKVVQKIEKEQ